MGNETNEVEDVYANVSRSKLKLKGDHSNKKKKKKDKEKIKMIAKTIELEKNEGKEGKISVEKRTKAEIAFQQMKEKNQTKRILDKANMTHKERVEKFNQHLDSLTEHFDIPKVSWTK